MKIFKAIRAWAGWRSISRNRAELIQKKQQLATALGVVIKLRQEIKRLER